MKDDAKKICETLLQLARLVFAGKYEDAKQYLQRVAFSSRKSETMVWIELNRLVNVPGILAEQRNYESVMRSDGNTQKVVSGGDELGMLSKSLPPIALEVEPIYNQVIHDTLLGVIKEHECRNEIIQAGLPLSNKLIFFGAPGVGKTLAAKWLANRMSLPLYTLDLAAVMSSLLGKTGNNIRQVFEFVGRQPCILLLDEFDAIAKTRGDDADVGELKRLVTVLLQEIDKFTNGSILIAATNHSEILDPAVWRRFDVKIDFSMPDSDDALLAVRRYLGADVSLSKDYIDILAMMFNGRAYSEIRRVVVKIRKAALISGDKLEDCVIRCLQEERNSMGRRGRKQFALALMAHGFSQHEASRISGASRVTIRKEMRNGGR